MAADEPAAPAESVKTATESYGALVYSVNRTPERPFDTARAVQVISAEEIGRRNARNVAELLIDQPAIFVQQTGYGGGSPIMRGLIGKQILILIDGVRMNTSTYRVGAVQYLSMIDISLVERVEIVRGIESVLGSDFALGGLINIVTKKGPDAGRSGLFGGSVTSRFSTADEGWATSVAVSGKTQSLRYYAGGTFRSANDVRGGSAVGAQIATGYDETGGNLNFEYSLDTEKTLSASYQALEQQDVPRTDRVVAGTNLLFEYNPQRLLFGHASYQDVTNRKFLDRLQVTAYVNRQDEGRQEIRTASPQIDRHLSDTQTAVGLNVEAASWLGSHRVIWGTDTSFERIHSTGISTDLRTGVTKAARGQWTDGATYRTLSAYIQDRFNVTKWVTVGGGARYSHVAVTGSENSSVGELTLDSTHNGITGAANIVVHVTPRLNLVSSYTRGSRAPNLDDLSVFNERGADTEIPNPGAKPEQSDTIELGLKYETARTSASVFYYSTNLTDLLIRAPSTVGGLSFFDLNGNGLKEANEPTVSARQNIGSSTVTGYELDLRYRVSSSWEWIGNYTRTVGNDELRSSPLDRIPPAFGAVSLRWAGALHRAPWAEVSLGFASAQTRLSSGDIADTRIGPQGTDGFWVAHLRGGADITQNVRATAAIENLADESYKYHASGVYRPGRQLVLGAQVKF